MLEALGAGRVVVVVLVELLFLAAASRCHVGKE